MPTLPGLDVTQAQYDRIVAAFPGATLAEKAANYKAWLSNNLIDEVERAEARKIEDAANLDKQAKLNALRESLPPRLAYPVNP
jgi:hypothetical protein